MNNLNKILVLTEEIGILKERYKPNSGMGNINTAISVLERRVEELQEKAKDAT